MVLITTLWLTHCAAQALKLHSEHTPAFIYSFRFLNLSWTPEAAALTVVLAGRLFWRAVFIYFIFNRTWVNMHKCSNYESLTGWGHNQLWLFAASSLCLGDLSNYTSTSTKQQGLIDSTQSSWWLWRPVSLCLPSAVHTPTTFSRSASREILTAVKPWITKLTLQSAPQSSAFSSPSLPQWFFSLTSLCSPHGFTNPLCRCDAAICSRCWRADNSLFISRLAAQRDLGIDEMPADWWLLNRLLFTPMTQLRGWREERRGGGGSGRRRFKHQKRLNSQPKAWIYLKTLWIQV